MVSISDGVTAYQFQYDLANRVTYVDNAGSVDLPQVQLYSFYDFEGNRTTLQDSLGGNVSYAWQNQRLQSMVLIAGAGKSAQVDLSYDSVGRLTFLTRTANGDPSTTINTHFALDLLDRVTSITHQKVMGEVTTTLSAFSYSLDANGRVASYSGPEGSLSFALDTNGQLLSVTGARAENYQYDPVGNRSTTITTPGNLLLNDGKYSYTYDLEGNLKTRTRLSDGQLTEYFWDHRNQLTKALVKDANGVLLKELRFTSDVQGRRVGVWVDADGAGPGNPDQVWTVFDGANPYMDFDGEGLLKTRYLHGPGIDELFARIGTGEDPQWYLADRLGSVRQIVDASGTVLDAIDYDSFGGILNETNPAQGDRFKFTGREYSPELGIYYYRARWYDPAAGRFISQDPIGFSAGDPNLYRYVGNAPRDARDPEGLQRFFQKPPHNAWSQENLISYSNIMDAPPEIKEKCKEDLLRLFNLVNNTKIRDITGNCYKWVDAVRNPIVLKVCKIKNAQWEYPVGIPFTGHWMGHMALEITLPDGKIFYVDNGWWGGNSHVFFKEDIPFYVFPYTPKGK